MGMHSKQHWWILIFTHMAPFSKIPTLCPCTQDIWNRWHYDPVSGADYMPNGFNVAKVNKNTRWTIRWIQKKTMGHGRPWAAFVPSHSFSNALGISCKTRLFFSHLCASWKKASKRGLKEEWKAGQKQIWRKQAHKINTLKGAFPTLSLLSFTTQPLQQIPCNVKWFWREIFPV